MKFFAFILCFSSLFLSNCQKDTCNEAVTFISMDATIGASPDTNTLISIKITWKRGAPLPELYFKDIFLMTGEKDYYAKPWVNDFELVSQTEVTSDSTMNILLKSENATLFTRPVQIHYQFSDRRSFLDCEHPGRDDDYLLDLILSLKKEADSTIQITQFNWEETLIKGGY